jgi:hypothetical protein
MTFNLLSTCSKHNLAGTWNGSSQASKAIKSTETKKSKRGRKGRYGMVTFPRCDEQLLLVPWRLLISTAGKEVRGKNATNTLDADPSALVRWEDIPHTTSLLKAMSTPGLQVQATVVVINIVITNPKLLPTPPKNDCTWIALQWSTCKKLSTQGPGQGGPGSSTW